MQLRVADSRGRYLLFALLALTINLMDGALARSIADPGRRVWVAAGATLDIVVIVTALYYWLLVRPGLRGPGSLIPIALLGVLGATFLYPNARTATALVAGLCEAGLLAFVVVHVRRARRNRVRENALDPVDAMHDGLRAVLAAPLARVLAAELSIFYYALFSWRAKPHVDADAQAFTLHQRDGRADLLYVLALASVFEIVPIHLLLHHWRPVWAWVATGVSFYGLVWLIGLARSLTLRPVLIGADFLDVRYGLLFRLRVPRASIASVRRAEPADAAAATRVPRRTEPTLCIELAQTLEAEGLLGIRQPVRRLALAPDDLPEFERALHALLQR